MRARARDVFASFSQSFDGCWVGVVMISTVSPLTLKSPRRNSKSFRT